MEKKHLTAVLIAKNEAKYLIEWIAFHRVVGFDFFYIYDNDSTDGTDALLAPLEKAGVCIRVPWSRSIHPSNPQVLAYRDAIARFQHEAEWMAILDADEFLVPITGETVSAVLRSQFEHADSVLVNWRVFGSSGLAKYDDRLCIDRFKMSSVESYQSNNHVKSIVRPSMVKEAFIHNHVMKSEKIFLSDGHNFKKSIVEKTEKPIYGHLQVNHYFCKSQEEFLLKRMKGLADYPLDAENAIRPASAFASADVNDVENQSATRFIEATKAEMQRLNSFAPVRAPATATG